MARSLATDIIELGKALESASALVSRKDSLEQACRETESRLASLREQESAAGASLAAAHEEAKNIVGVAKVQAAACVKAAEVQAAEEWSDCQTQCASAVAANEAVCKELQEKAKELRTRIKLLEKEETKVSASVAAFRADLAAIKAKLG